MFEILFPTYPSSGTTSHCRAMEHTQYSITETICSRGWQTRCHVFSARSQWNTQLLAKCRHRGCKCLSRNVINYNEDLEELVTLIKPDYEPPSNENEALTLYCEITCSGLILKTKHVLTLQEMSLHRTFVQGYICHSVEQI